MGETARIDAVQQCYSALDRANQVRLARAESKRRIGRGDLTAAEVIYTCPWQAAKMPVDEVLMSQKGWGVRRCRRLLARLDIAENKRVGTLTDRQRIELVRALAGLPPGNGVPASTSPPGPTPRAARSLRPARPRERELSAV